MYWDRAWKLVEGCTKVSAGCENCWSEQETFMRCGHPNAVVSERARVVLDSTGFYGHITCRHDNLDLPLRVKKPTVFAVWNDLFHEGVTESFRNHAYNIMCRCRQHTFLVLTKRHRTMWDHLFRNGEQDTHEMIRDHIWHGVTVEDQQRADERIPLLLRVPGKRFISIEPMLGSISFSFGTCKNCGGRGWIDTGELDQMLCLCNLNGATKSHGVSSLVYLHAVLLGGESGKNARPMHPDWTRSVRDQCTEAGVPFFFKQWGEWIETDDAKLQSFGKMARVGKRRAGRLLDGRTHDDLPWS